MEFPETLVNCSEIYGEQSDVVDHKWFDESEVLMQYFGSHKDLGLFSIV